MNVEINYIVHSTEDPNKILISLSNMLKIKIDKRNIKRYDVTGHYGNPLSYVIIKIKNKQAGHILKRVLNLLPESEKFNLLNNLEEYFHKSTFYLRVNKQNMCLGYISLSEEDAVRFVFKGVKREYIKKLLEGG